METKTGFIKRYNKKENMMPGIQLNDGYWYNATQRTQSYVEGLQGKEGAMVKINHENGNISFIEVLTEPPAFKNGQQPQQKPQQNTNTNQKGHGAFVGMAINNAAKIVSDKNMQFNDENEWAALVVRYANALIREMQNQRLN